VGFKGKGFRKDLAYESLYNKTVYIEFDETDGLKGYYGRYLAYVYLPNGTDFNALQGFRAKIKSRFVDFWYYLWLAKEVKLKIVPMKRKIASLSIDKGVLRLNQNVVEKLDEKELRYILLHELIHLKVNDVNHGSLFMKELEKYLEFEKTREIEIEIIKKLIQ